ncbi:MAG: DUF2703 domain-containing protein [Crenarchaeota archaeon]|nr:DUF2703 domain-containing protein [Thermoproteota archaeon]
MKRKEVKNKTLKIKWQRLMSDGKTCPRCRLTEKELEKAISTLKQALALMNIQVILEKDELSIAEFEKDPLKSNQILINGLPLEDWIDGKVGQSPCCDVCGSSECRTVTIGEEAYEVIPADLIIKASLLAASQLVATETNKPCCEKAPTIDCCRK